MYRTILSPKLTKNWRWIKPEKKGKLGMDSSMAMDSSPKKQGKLGMDSSTAMDSSTTKDKAVPIFCLSCLLLLALVSFPMIVVLSLRTANGSQVKASVTDLYAPVVTYNSACNFLTIPSIFFALSLHDDTNDLDIYYDDIILKFYYVGSFNTSNIPIAEYTWPGFYQAGETQGTFVRYYDHVKTQGIYLEEASKDASEIVLRLNLETAVRFQSVWWKGEKHKLLVGSNVMVSTITGKKVEIGSLELKPYTEHGSGGHYETARFFLNSYFVFLCIFLVCMPVILNGKDGDTKWQGSYALQKFQKIMNY